MPSVANSLRTYVFSDLLEQDGFVHPESMFDLLINIKDKDGKVESIKAHKLLLSLVSPVFKTLIRNNQSIMIDELQMVDLTEDVNLFSIMLRFLYSGDETEIRDIMELEILFQLFTMFQAYQIRGSIDLFMDIISKVEVSSKNYSEVFTVLNKYEKEFMCEQICNLLNTRCIQSITQEWSCVDDVLKFWRENYDEDMEMMTVLFRRILMSKDLIFKKDDKSVLKCANCKMDPANCLNGKSVVKFPPSNGDLKIKVTSPREITSDQGYVCPAESSGVLIYFNKYEVATPQPDRYSSGIDVSLTKKQCCMLSINWGGDRQLSCYSKPSCYVNYNCR